MHNDLCKSDFIAVSWSESLAKLITRNFCNQAQKRFGYARNLSPNCAKYFSTKRFNNVRGVWVNKSRKFVSFSFSSIFDVRCEHFYSLRSFWEAHINLETIFSPNAGIIPQFSWTPNKPRIKTRILFMSLSILESILHSGNTFGGLCSSCSDLISKYLYHRQMFFLNWTTFEYRNLRLKFISLRCI